ncbi:MAG: hypothetical protein ACOC33_02105 [bacterium]
MKKRSIITEAERYFDENEEDYENTYSHYERSLDILRKITNFSARGRDWNIDIVDEGRAGEFVEIYNDEDDTFIRVTPYWEGMHLPLGFYINDGDDVYTEKYPLEDMSGTSDEEFKNYLIQNLEKAVNDIPEDIYNKYIK